MASSSRIRASLIQVNAGNKIEDNLKRLEFFLRKAFSVEPNFVALPENFAWRGPSEDLPEVASHSPAIIEKLKRIAKKENVAILLGSLIERSSVRCKFYNTSYWISGKGIISAKYRKIHLFDVSLQGRFRVRESDHILPGTKTVTLQAGNVTAGLSVCYDVRFPELYRDLSSKGSKILFVPSNFTHETGKAHWDVLLRARAIENLCFVVAPGQVGRHPENGIRSYGRSLILDPWGRKLAEGSSEKEGVLWADLDLTWQAALRREFPVLKHRRLGQTA